MKNFIEKSLIVLFGLPIGIVLFIAIAFIATLFLLIYVICKCVEYIIKLFKHDFTSHLLSTFLEFIFVLYGFSTLFLLMPLAAIKPNILD